MQLLASNKDEEMKLEERCTEQVHDGRVGFYRCLRASGFGPDGAYCKQHSRKYEKIKPALTIWKTPSKYAIGELPKAVLVRENGENTFIDADGRRCKKVTDWDHYLDTLESALWFCLARAETNLSSAREKVEGETKQVALFITALTEGVKK